MLIMGNSMYNDMMSRNRRKTTIYIKKGTSATTQFILLSCLFVGVAIYIIAFSSVAVVVVC